MKLEPAKKASHAKASKGMKAAPSAGFLARVRVRGAVRSFLGISLFWKIILANLLLVAVGAVSGVVLTLDSGRVGLEAVTAASLATAVVLILFSVAVNVGLVRLALSPIDTLVATVRQVREGETKARATASAVADPGLRRLADVLNEMLDTLSVNRRRQKELARRVLESEERERQRIAHELYAGTAQTLAGVLVRLRIAERHLSSGANGSIDEIREEVVSALEEIRGVARRLRPPELDELGVRVALEAHVRSMPGSRAIDVQFDGDVPPLSRESNLALFRIVQEAISNVILHSGAESLRVRFSAHEDGVLAEVEDDGRGFDVGSALAHAGESLGLFGMHERAGYVHGELSLESGPGRGTLVRVIIPRQPDLGFDEAGRGALDGTIDRLVEGLVDDEPDLAATAATETAPEPTRF